MLNTFRRIILGTAWREDSYGDHNGSNQRFGFNAILHLGENIKLAILVISMFTSRLVSEATEGEMQTSWLLFT